MKEDYQTYLLKEKMKQLNKYLIEYFAHLTKDIKDKLKKQYLQRKYCRSTMQELEKYVLI